MLNQKEMNSITQVDEFAEILAAARRMQQDWLEYGVNYVHLYVEDVEGDWLETWGNDEILGDSLLDTIKEFLVSNDDVAVKIRQNIRDQPLFDLAISLEECLRISREGEKTFAVRDILARYLHVGEIDLFDLASSLRDKLL
ncbi:hypothetical protein A0J48_000825 [Sphaerospermopsis aphanizomenoides BCCUSP55]|uniref:hypothetical protein n=1 Tax=Sphaerospermopsis aphanizomenoides TaxID=459663 RepID=UPI00190601FF|nr:hypothetical protein [Sphaerospermopsis aphanizomenoides]MBK1986108.1 hypothetical protein [Sphaerospermopsis aphanizomenoides BCCUSP55]